MIYNRVKELFKFAESDVKRIGLGLPAIDEAIRGVAPGEVCMVMGRSYSGKSIIGQNIVYNNANIPSIFFSLEMPAMQALIRLYSMWSNTSATEVQESVEAGSPDPEMWQLADVFQHHEIIDTSGMSIHDMSIALDEFEGRHKMRPEFIVVDYLELIGGAKASGEGYLATEKQATMLKDWAREENQRVFVMHQTNRQERQWMPPTEDSARNAGFTEADFVIGLWLPRKDPDLQYVDKLRYSHVIAANVLKNRPFFKEIEKVHLELEPSLRIWKEQEETTFERNIRNDAAGSEEQQSYNAYPFAD